MGEGGVVGDEPSFFIKAATDTSKSKYLFPWGLYDEAEGVALYECQCKRENCAIKRFHHDEILMMFVFKYSTTS